MSEHDSRKGPQGRNDRRRGGQNRTGRGRTKRATGQSRSSEATDERIRGGKNTNQEQPVVGGASVRRPQKSGAADSSATHDAARGMASHSVKGHARSKASPAVAEPTQSGIGFDSVNDMGADHGAGRSEDTVGRSRESMAANVSGSDGGRWQAVRDVVTLKSPRVRRYLWSAAGADFLVLLLVVSLAVIGVTVAGGGITPLPASIASTWMALNLAPFRYAGTNLSLIPALPAMGLFAFVAWRVRREVRGPISIRDVRAMVASFVVLPVLLTLIAWFMLVDASSVLRVDTPNVLHALLSTIAIHAGGVCIGMGPRLWRALLRRRKLPEWVLSSLSLALRFVMWLWAAGALVAVAVMAIRFNTAREAFAITDSAGGAVMLGVLSLLYLPNIAFAAAGVLMGAPANVGIAEVSLFAVTPGTLPPLPTLAAMPQSLATPAVAALLVIPVALSVWLTVQHVRSGSGDNAYRDVVGAAFIAGLVTSALAALLGGQVGYYGWSGVSWWLAGVLASVWLAVPGVVVVVALTGMARNRGRAAELDDASLDDAEEVADEETDTEEVADEEVAKESAKEATKEVAEDSDDAARG